jgi:hypothetical protein
VSYRALKLALRDVALVLKDRTLPRIIIGVIGITFFFAFVLHAEPVVVYGLLLLGCFTAVVEVIIRFKGK